MLVELNVKLNVGGAKVCFNLVIILELKLFKVSEVALTRWGRPIELVLLDRLRTYKLVPSSVFNNKAT